MPFDGNPAKFTETKHDVFSLEGLIAWLETQSPHTVYDFADCRGACLMGRYIIARGERWCSDNYNKIGAVAPLVAACLPHTFGAALDRARALLAERT